MLCESGDYVQVVDVACSSEDETRKFDSNTVGNLEMAMLHTTTHTRPAPRLERPSSAMICESGGSGIDAILDGLLAPMLGLRRVGDDTFVAL